MIKSIGPGPNLMRKPSPCSPIIINSAFIRQAVTCSSLALAAPQTLQGQQGKENKYPISTETSVLPLNSSGFLLSPGCLLCGLKKELLWPLHSPLSPLASALFRHNGGFSERRADNITSQAKSLIPTLGLGKACSARSCSLHKSHLNTADKPTKAWRALLIGITFSPQTQKNKEFPGMWLI